MTEGNTLSSKRWNYSKRLSGDDTSIIELVRTRHLLVEYLKSGRWVPAEYKDWLSIREILDYEWLTTRERQNLRSYLACGQKEIPVHLDREPREQYLKWICPTCQSRTIAPITIGFPSPETSTRQRMDTSFFTAASSAGMNRIDQFRAQGATGTANTCEASRYASFRSAKFFYTNKPSGKRHPTFHSTAPTCIN